MTETDETLYEHAGGDQGLHHLEEIFYAKALADPVLKQLFTEPVATHVEHLTWFTAESFGGPNRFSRELGFQYLMATTAGAFFAGKTWPERLWEAFRAAAQSIDDTPTFAHVAFVEAYAVGPHAIQRVEDSRAAFTIFLQEGYRWQQSGAPPSRLALEAIITTIFEIVYLQARASATPKTAGFVSHFLHLCLTPFIGAAAANELIAKRPAAKSRSRKSATRSRH